MMKKLLLVTLRPFSKLNQQLINTLRQDFFKNPTTNAFGQYFISQNVQALLKIIVQAKITIPQSNAVLSSLLNLCTTETDAQLNIIANILKQRGINNVRIGDLPSAISDLQQAISTVLLMSHPSPIVLSQFYKFTADLYLQVGELKKAENALLEAQNLLIELQSSSSQLPKQIKSQSELHQLSQDQRLVYQDHQNYNSGLACIYTQMCMIKYRDRRPMEALDYLQKALSHWEGITRKILKQYELTCRLKVMLSMLFNQKNQALHWAQHFLTFLHQSLEYKSSINKQIHQMTSLYYLNIICICKPDANEQKERVVEILKKIHEEKGEKRLTETMMLLGIKKQTYSLQTQ